MIQKKFLLPPFTDDEIVAYGLSHLSRVRKIAGKQLDRNVNPLSTVLRVEHDTHAEVLEIGCTLELPEQLLRILMPSHRNPSGK